MESVYPWLVAASSRKNNLLLQTWRRTHDSLSRRCLHTRRSLPYEVQQGLGKFLPPTALKTVAVDWQEGLLKRLNDEVKGTSYEHQTVLNTVIGTAPDRNMSLAFNYASQALNNSFFLDYLKPPSPTETDHENELSTTLQVIIRADFGGMDSMKSAVSAAAMGMISSGWIWVVTDRTGRLSIIPTFGAGTLLVRGRMQAYVGEHLVVGEEAPSRPTSGRPHASSPLPPFKTGSTTITSPLSGVEHPPSGLNPQTPSRSLHSSASIYAPRHDRYHGQFNINDPDLENKIVRGNQSERTSRIGERISPLFCISVHEHAWMSAGFGVWGKEEYLQQFWTVLDWRKVSDAYSRSAEIKM